MYTIVPFRRAFDSAFAPLFNDHFMREFFDASNAPEMRVDVRERMRSCWRPICLA